ncbi:MAG: hypothetical protein ACHQNV_04430 [Vicinamibacteria bacterium]
MKGQARAGGDPQELQRRRDAVLSAGTVITGYPAAQQFLLRVGVALRYASTPGLPLASLYDAFGARADKASLSHAIRLTNQLLGEARAIEVHVVAGRVSLVHRALVPSLYALVRRGRKLDDLEGLSPRARTALALLRQTAQVTAGDVRQRLGLRFDARQDPAYVALGELTRRLLVDRGPFEIPRKGIPYLSTEGYPYHLFHEAHPELVAAAQGISLGSAAETFLEAYLNGIVFAGVRKLTTLFGAFLSPTEIERALAKLSRKGKVTLAGTGQKAIAIAAEGGR